MQRIAWDLAHAKVGGDSSLASRRGTFFITDHYREYSTVLIRLATVTVDELRKVFVQAWRLNASRRAISEFDSRRS